MSYIYPCHYKYYQYQSKTITQTNLTACDQNCLAFEDGRRYAELFSLLQVFTEYFKELEEESIQDNFVVVYELLDELMDFGFPQTTDSKILQEWDT